jgi:signal transduction histidine kinase/CheY-like chemotaxis protein
MNNWLLKIRRNGIKFIKPGESYSHIVYTNLIWMISIFSYNIYVVFGLFFLPINNITIGFFFFFNSCFYATYLAIKNGYIHFGKHLLVIASHSSMMIYDHLIGRNIQTYLIFYAMLPAAVNIFHIKKHFYTISFYSLLPIVYFIGSKYYTSVYLYTPYLTVSSPIAMNICVIALAVLLVIAFSFYMVIRSDMKQSKLKFQRVGLQKTLDVLGKAIWTVDSSLNITVLNEAFIKYVKVYYGFTIKEGMNIKEIGLWKLIPNEWKLIYNDVIAGEEQNKILIVNNKEFDFTASPIYDKNRNVIGGTFSSQDITKEKEFERELIEAKIQSEAASKAKERFLSNMSHEIRTPLNGIIGIIDILKDGEHLPVQNENLNNLGSLSTHTLDLINNVLDFAKIEEGKANLDIRRFNLSELLEKVNAIFKNTSKLKGIAFDIIVNGNADIYVKGDDIRLTQVLINLIGNALKFTEHGFVKLIVDITSNNSEPHFECKFNVIDSGIGIKQEHFGKIFEVFDQAEVDTTRRFGGTGLGLSISKKILQLMNSDLELQSIKDVGSSFYFTVAFDKSSVEAEIDITKILMNSKEKLNGLNILMAEDNKINQLVAKTIISKWNCNLTIVANGYEAVEAAEKNTYDIILMDLDMPVMDGYEAARILNEKKLNIPIIALTAASFDNMHFHLTKKGFSSVVQKPFKKELLYTEIVRNTSYNKKELVEA